MLLLVGLTAACSSETVPDPETQPQENCDDGLCLTVPETGFQLRTVGTEIPPGADVEYCEVLTIPGEPGEKVYIDRMEVKMSDFSHHLIVTAFPIGDPEAEMWEDGERRECAGFEAFSFFGVVGSQVPYLDEPYPEGVGRVYEAGQKLLFDYHYYNTSAEPVAARAAVNFHTTTEDDVERVANDLMALLFDIATPPMSTGTYTGECTFRKDVEVYKWQRHTHRWGRDFDIFYAGGDRDGEHVWTSEHFETTDFRPTEPTILKEGSSVQFRCEIENDTPNTIRYGVKATDEMCNLFGVLYPPEGETGDLGPHICFIEESLERQEQQQQ